MLYLCCQVCTASILIHFIVKGYYHIISEWWLMTWWSYIRVDFLVSHLCLFTLSLMVITILCLVCLRLCNTYCFVCLHFTHTLFVCLPPQHTLCLLQCFFIYEWSGHIPHFVRTFHVLIFSSTIFVLFDEGYSTLVSIVPYWLCHHNPLGFFNH